MKKYLMEKTLTSEIIIEEIRRASGLEAIFSEWGKLWERCPEATPFQLPEWLLPWCKYFCPQELFVLAFRSGNKLLGLAPLMLEQEFGPEKLRRLAFIGTGNTDYMDILLTPEYSKEITSSLFRYLYENNRDWDICHLEELRPGSALLNADYGNLNAQIRPLSVCPVIFLPRSEREYCSSLPAEFKSRLKRAQKTLFKMGEISFERAGAGNYLDFLNAFFELHTRWWVEKKNGKGALYGNDIQAFHKEVARGFLGRGILSLYGMRLNGEFAAIVYAFASRGRVYSYLGGFEPALERLSPGNILIEYVIKEAIRDGKSEFDFLRGAEKYKYSWGARSTTNYILELSC